MSVVSRGFWGIECEEQGSGKEQQDHQESITDVKDYKEPMRRNAQIIF